MAREIAQLPLEGKSVLELGCGNGLCSLAAAASGAASVLATDLSADALGLTADAAKAAQLPVATAELDLGGPEPLPPADLVVAADLLYDEALAALVAARVAEAMRRGSTVLVGSDLQRGPRHGFLAKLRELAPPRGADEPPLAFDDSVRVALPAVRVEGEADRDAAAERDARGPDRDVRVRRRSRAGGGRDGAQGLRDVRRHHRRLPRDLVRDRLCLRRELSLARINTS